MSKIKNKKEIEYMRQGGKILAEVLWEIMDNIKPGVSELDLDRLAERLILQKGGEPGFKRVPGYKNTICISTNDVVVHGIPTDYRFKEGDVVGIDCGVFYKGFNTDMAETVQIQDSKVKSQKVDKFLKVGKKALEESIRQAKVGNRIGNISETMQRIIERENGYFVVRNLVGHGVGEELHEEPEVPGFLSEPIEKTPLLEPGMTIAIEAIYNMGGYGVVYSNDDDWTIKTKDHSISGLFERTVLITPKGPIVLTK